MSGQSSKVGSAATLCSCDECKPTPHTYTPGICTPAASALLAENQRLREAIEDYILWRPGERGHAAAHRRLCEALAVRG